MTKEEIQHYGLKSIEIVQFRNMRDITISLGQRVTVLAGQNGTGKSTILGMLGQPFGMNDAQTLFGKAFRTKFTDIFKMSPSHDFPGEHLYYINFHDSEAFDGKQHVQVKSYARKETDKSHIRLVTGASRNRGEGNLSYPVIYLGMKRVYPVGEITNPETSDAELSIEETERFIRWYSRIMVSTSSNNIDPIKFTKRGQKESLLVNTNEYDYLANSAGQDNLGQILAAIISFQRLQKAMGDEYTGGLLLIDEIDATLFPASQIGLLRLLYDIALELNLQIVFTTHSMDLIEYSLSLSKKCGGIEVIYLKSLGSRVLVENNISMDSIRCDLLIEPLSPEKEMKVEIWCEDAEAKWFIHKMLPRRIARKCSIQSAHLSCGELAELSIREIPAIRNVLFVTDADGVKHAAKKIKESERLFVLPGDGESPERSIYSLLNGFPEDDSRWNLFSRGYNKQLFRKLRDDIEDEQIHKGGKIDRKLEKAWFKKTKQEGFWGINGKTIYRLWAVDHKEEIDLFCRNLEHRVDAVLSRIEFENRKSN